MDIYYNLYFNYLIWFSTITDFGFIVNVFLKCSINNDLKQCQVSLA